MQELKAFKNFYALWSKKFYIKVCKISGLQNSHWKYNLYKGLNAHIHISDLKVGFYKNSSNKAGLNFSV